MNETRVCTACGHPEHAHDSLPDPGGGRSYEVLPGDLRCLAIVHIEAERAWVATLEGHKSMVVQPAYDYRCPCDHFVGAL